MFQKNGKDIKKVCKNNKFEILKVKKMYFLTLVPRLFIKLFRIKHKHHYIYNGTFDAGLAGNVREYICIWCGDNDIRY